MNEEIFFTIDFFILTLMAWLVGRQYGKAQYYEKKARSSEKSYEQLIDSLPESVIIHRDNRIVYVNKASLCMIGAHSMDDIIGKSIHDFIVSEYEEHIQERIKQVKKEKRLLNSIEHRIKRFDGSIFFFEVSSLNIEFGGIEAVLSIGKDTTIRKAQTEQILQKPEKLALVGQMAAGIAHEIRNPLTSIKGFMQLLKDNNMDQEYFEIVFSELERINSIVDEFLVLAKPSVVTFVEQDVRILIKDAVALINSQSVLNNVHISFEFEGDLPSISCEKII